MLLYGWNATLMCACALCVRRSMRVRFLPVAVVALILLCCVVAVCVRFARACRSVPSQCAAHVAQLISVRGCCAAIVVPPWFCVRTLFGVFAVRCSRVCNVCVPWIAAPPPPPHIVRVCSMCVCVCIYHPSQVILMFVHITLSIIVICSIPNYLLLVSFTISMIIFNYCY